MTVGSKWCSRCRLDLEATAFHRRLSRGPGAWQTWCKTCVDARRRERRLENPVTEWAKASIIRIRHRAKVRGLKFDLTADYLASLAPTNCPVLGLALDYKGGATGRSGGIPTSASVDRLIPELGYTVGNVAVISMRANCIKQNATPHEIMRVGRFFYAAQLHNSGETHGSRRIRRRGGWAARPGYALTFAPGG